MADTRVSFIVTTHSHLTPDLAPSSVFDELYAFAREHPVVPFNGEAWTTERTAVRFDCEGSYLHVGEPALLVSALRALAPRTSVRFCEERFLTYLHQRVQLDGLFLPPWLSYALAPGRSRQISALVLDRAVELGRQAQVFGLLLKNSDIDLAPSPRFDLVALEDGLDGLSLDRLCEDDAASFFVLDFAAGEAFLFVMSRVLEAAIVDGALAEYLRQVALGERQRHLKLAQALALESLLTLPEQASQTRRLLPALVRRVAQSIVGVPEWLLDRELGESSMLTDPVFLKEQDQVIDLASVRSRVLASMASSPTAVVRRQ